MYRIFEHEQKYQFQYIGKLKNFCRFRFVPSFRVYLVCHCVACFTRVFIIIRIDITITTAANFVVAFENTYDGPRASIDDSVLIFCDFNLVFFHFIFARVFFGGENKEKSDPLTNGKFLFLVNKRIVRVFVDPTNHSYHLAGAINNGQNPKQKKLKFAPRLGDVPNWRRFTKARQIAVQLTFEVTKIVKHLKTFSSAPSLCLDTFDSVSLW